VAHPATVVEGRHISALFQHLLTRTALAQTSTVEAYTTGEGAALASVHLVSVGPASDCGSRHDRRGRYSCLCTLVRLVLRAPLCWRARNLKALPRTLFARSLCAQPTIVKAGTTGEGAALPLFALSAWAQPATVSADTSGKGASMASVLLVDVGPASHCGCGHDR
jgi:hypothetical protein